MRVSNDFAVSTTITQEVALDGRHMIVVQCFCPNVEVRRDTKLVSARLTIFGHYDSVGYHGEQEPPKSIPYEQLAFVERRDPESVTLVSRERSFMHHASTVRKLTIDAPPGIGVRFDSLQWHQLEERKVD
ncbi:MAG TPA: hypothetical protein VM555_02640 [Tahibacter sp.]|nr:hypothetical protein [Tahibacter sp.]